jgi:SAM-dependent methyltransferase
VLDDSLLERSSVVANNAMNRERGLDGVNSYTRELGFHPLDRLAAGQAWLDLCCGSGRALLEASKRGGYTLVGVDLVEYFVDSPVGAAGPELVTASLSTWRPERTFDLITCVHGLHYIGDKLGLLARAASWLSPGGLFAGHLDLNNLKTPKPFRPSRFGLEYDTRRRIVKCLGPRRLDFPYEYLGADPDAGPNHTGQPAVDSVYRSIDN